MDVKEVLETPAGAVKMLGGMIKYQLIKANVKIDLHRHAHSRA